MAIIDVISILKESTISCLMPIVKEKNLLKVKVETSLEEIKEKK